MSGVGTADRVGRVARNDAAITAAVCDILADGGFGQLTAAEVARRAGMSKRPVLARCPRRSDLALTGWHECGPVLAAVLTSLVGAVDGEQRLEAWLALAHPSPMIRAAAELIVAAQFDDVLADAVTQTLDLERLITGPLEDRARSAYVIGTGLGLLWISQLPIMDRADFRDELLRTDAATRVERSAIELPSPSAPHLDSTVIDSGDAIRDALLRSACEVVAAVGFDAATTAGIAAGAGVSEGALFRRYPTKLAVFLDATQAQQRGAMRANEDFLSALARDYSQGTAEAVTLREYCRPERAMLRTLLLEQLRVSWHDPELLSVTSAEIAQYVEYFGTEHPEVPDDQLWAHSLVGLAVGTGMPVLAALHEETVTYPFDVVTIPLEDAAMSPADGLDRA